MDWLPLYDKCIVRREAPDEKMSEEIDLATPDQYKKRKNRGVVIAVGEGRICPDGSLLPLTVKVGHQVLFGQHSGVDMEEPDHVMLREDEILAYRDAE